MFFILEIDFILNFNKIIRIAALHIILFIKLVFLLSCSVSNNPLQKELKKLQKGIIKDDSSFVYKLPYQENESHLLVQGYFSRYTHKNRAALDFKMKKGTKVCAARAGVVLRIKADGKSGGGNAKYRSYGNYIIVQHTDSTRSGYWHLQHNAVFVKVGDTVKQGEVIGLSGKTGFTYLPHLHFVVWRFNKDGQWIQVGSRFQTSAGIRYLRPLRFYRNQIPAN